VKNSVSPNFQGNFVDFLRDLNLQRKDKSGVCLLEFEFIVNGSVIESEIGETASLFPRIREQLSVDGSALLNSFFQVKLLQKKDC
jgi:hypothetical protein